MKLIDENYNEITTMSDTRVANLFWHYDIEHKDFFIRTCPVWYNITSDAYKVKIGKDIISIPYNYYILIGDFDGGLDCISPDEIIGREFQAFTFANNLEDESWILEDIKIVGYEEDVVFVTPFVKGFFPILTSDKRAILVSSTDMYMKIKDMTFSDIL